MRAQVDHDLAVEGGCLFAVWVRHCHRACGLVDDGDMLVEVNHFLWVEVGLWLGFGRAHAQFDAVACTDGTFAFGDARAVEEDLPRVDPCARLVPCEVEVLLDGFVEPCVVERIGDEALGRGVGVLGVWL